MAAARFDYLLHYEADRFDSRNMVQQGDKLQ
jgi:hypothetical protein